MRYRTLPDLDYAVYNDACVQKNFKLVFVSYTVYGHYSTRLHLPPLRFHCVWWCWDRTHDCCDFGIDSQTLKLLGYSSSTLGWIILGRDFWTFVGHFCLHGSGSGSTDQSNSRFGSEALKKIKKSRAFVLFEHYCMLFQLNLGVNGLLVRRINTYKQCCGSGIPSDWVFESFETLRWVENILWCGSGSGIFFNPGPEIRNGKLGSWIRYKHPGSVTLHTY